MNSYEARLYIKKYDMDPGKVQKRLDRLRMLNKYFISEEEQKEYLNSRCGKEM